MQRIYYDIASPLEVTNYYDGDSTVRVDLMLSSSSVVIEIGHYTAEDPEAPTDTVYAFVPIKLVDSVLEMHGGIVGADMSNDGAGVWKGFGAHD